MIVKLEMAAAMEKMEALGAELLEQPAFKELRNMIDVFVADKPSVERYNSFVQNYHELQEKEAAGQELSSEEIEEYEQLEKELYANDITRRFIYAQNEFEKLQNAVSNFLRKTIELNRLPQPDELKSSGSCGCGGSCGSGH